MTGIEHPDELDLSALVDGRLSALEAEPLRRHLAGCRSCMAAYADAVRYRAAWLATPQAFEPSRELVEAGMAVRAKEPARAGAAAPRSLGRARPAGRRVAMAGATLALAGATLALAAVVFYGVRAAATWRAPDPPLPPPLRAALESVSGRGLVLPGGERGAAHRGPVLRAGPAAPRRSLEAAVRAEIERYERGRRDRATTYAVGAGLIALGQADAARDYVDEGLRRDPRDARLLVLRADLAYRASEMALAESCLRQSLRLRRDDPVATLDLGIVLAETGARDQAAMLLARAARRGAPPIAARATRELEALRPR